MVREDKVDILVELTGHTANNKLGMMACRPAPIQVLIEPSHIYSPDMSMTFGLFNFNFDFLEWTYWKYLNIISSSYFWLLGILICILVFLYRIPSEFAF